MKPLNKMADLYQKKLWFDKLGYQVQISKQSNQLKKACNVKADEYFREKNKAKAIKQLHKFS
jgi:hypothetical protein